VLPNGARTRYAHDLEDALIGVEHDGYWLVIERDALGREIQRSAGEGRISIRSAYDAMDRLIDQHVTAPSPMDGVPAALVQRQGHYDRAGRVTRIDDARWDSKKPIPWDEVTVDPVDWGTVDNTGQINLHQ
jgi:hypothetical protein